MYDYNYLEAVENDVRNYISDEIERTEWLNNRDKLEEKLYENLWSDDSVTGNGSGSYTFSTYKAEEYLCHNWDLLNEAASEFGENAGDWIKKGAEFCDVSIRCYLLSQAISNILNELENNGFFA